MVKLTTNKELYQKFKKQDTFSDRLIYLLLHFAFFLKVYKNNENKSELQDIYDYFFRQLELSIREIGYGDQSINKKMKDYLNLFHSMIDKIHEWEIKSFNDKNSFFEEFENIANNSYYLTQYFDKYVENLTKKTLTYHLKSVVNQ